jgi:hypothetical protein
MSRQLKRTATELFNNPNSRVILVLTTLVIAALVGGAPHDFGGG